VHADLLAQFTVFAKSPWGLLRLSPTLFMYVVGYLELTCAFAIVHAQRNGGNKKLPVFVLFCVLYCAVMTHAWHQDGKHWPAFILAMVAAFILTEDTSGGKAVKAASEATATARAKKANETKKSK
jgi:hypothetical protein